MPSLPHNDPEPERRQRRLEDARETYRFDHGYRDYALAAEIPWRDRFDARYIAEAIENKLAVGSNCAASKLSAWVEDEWDELRSKLGARLSSAKPDAVTREFGDADGEVRQRVPRRHPLRIEDYADMFPLLPDPASMQHWREDWYFAWQRIAGCNPILIQRATQLPDTFLVTEEHYARAIEGDTLAAATAEGRLWLVDHTMMAGVPLGQTDGRPKFLPAPLSLYAWTKQGRLMPVAIQCGPKPGPDTPIYTPGDGLAWDMAKTTVQIADANFQGVISHLGHCHLVMESVVLAAHRQLGEDHPIKLLLEPHWEFTLAVNEVMRDSVINPDGKTDRLQSGSLSGSTELVLQTLATYPICRTDAPTAFADRGVADPTGLSDYPFRDDAMASYTPLHAFVRSYVELYYHGPDQVAGDVELQAWVREMGAPEAGKLHRVTESGRVDTVDELVMLLTRLLYTCTIYHASINYSSYDFLAYVPNMPTAGFAPGLEAGVEPSEAALAKVMTPLDLGFETISLMYSLTMRHNRLGEYPRRQFEDARVAPLIERFAGELEAAEATIRARNRVRPVAYPYLLPSNITASIHV